jgi:hypothetical protein
MFCAPPDFYRELAGLYRTAYPRYKVLVAELYLLLHDLGRRDLSFDHLQYIWDEVQHLSEPGRYLTDVRRGTA